MRCPSCNTRIPLWRTALFYIGSIKCRQCGAILALENVSKKLSISVVALGMISIRFLELHMAYWQALVIVLAGIGLAQSLFCKLIIKIPQEPKQNG
jgi:DNA-directed RNA polymerase subunit RPC12/RpoP